MLLLLFVTQNKFIITLSILHIITNRKMKGDKDMFDMISNSKRKNDMLDFNNFFSEFFPDIYTNIEGKMMRVDIKENDNSYIFDVEIPGANKEDINLVVNEDVLTINVTTKSQVAEEKDNYIRRERKFGSFTRSFSIPYLDKDQINAKYENGVLHITLPKRTNNHEEVKKINIE
ncbi:MAG: heat shock protein Hsp20 [Haloplasmataceae bacterium]|nr:heat shock protein Hsp20 [Haloplasmataceae bacterium]